jgi:hypothetical protein
VRKAYRKAGKVNKNALKLDGSAKVAWLKEFFKACDLREGEGAEPEWEDHKRLLTGRGARRWN